jgi:hypothetical protein
MDSESGEIFSGMGVLTGIYKSNATREQIHEKLIQEFPKHLGTFSFDDLRLDEASSFLVDPESNLWFLRYEQVYQGLPVLNSEANFHLKKGNLVHFDFSIYPELSTSVDPKYSSQQALAISMRSLGCEAETCEAQGKPALAIYPQGNSGKTTDHLVWVNHVVSANPPAIWVSTVDAHSGALVENYNTIFYVSGTIAAGVHPRAYFNDKTKVPVKDLFVFLGDDYTLTDESGFFSFPKRSGKLRFSVHGARSDVKSCPEVQVNWLAALSDLAAGSKCGSSDRVFQSDISGEGEGIQIMLTEKVVTDAELDVYNHVNEVVDASLPFLDNPWFYEVLPSFVNIERIKTKFVIPLFTRPAACNAFWNGESINFFERGSVEAGNGTRVECANTGQISDIIYHEWGHGLDASLHRGDIPDPAKSEAIGDIVAFHLTDDPVIAPGFFISGVPKERNYIREVDSDKIYPDDMEGEPHTDSLIFSSLWWNLREGLIQAYGYEMGNATSANLFFKHLAMSSSFTKSLGAVLTVDDDDGNLGNGTPNRELIMETFAKHGLGQDS